MKPDYRHITEAELSVMQVLWEKGTATTRQITEILYPEGSVSQYYTVQKLLERLEEKGCVARDRAARAHQFRAALDRNALIGERLQELSEKICGGSLVPMLTELVQLRQLSTDEYDLLKKLVSDLDKNEPGKRSRRKRK